MKGSRIFWTVWCAAFFAWDLFAGTVYALGHQWGMMIFNYAFAGLMLLIYWNFKRQWARQDELDARINEGYARLAEQPQARTRRPKRDRDEG